MKTKEFLELLKENQGKSLLFQYSPNNWVGANYHITEVKNIIVDSVDCGGEVDAWKETIVQLWESPSEVGKKEYMSAYKALSVLKKVDRVKAMDQEAEIKFEYSNDYFHTAQLFVNDYVIQGQQIQVRLAVQNTDCKAKEACGIPEPTINTCNPNSGCC